MSFAIAQYDYEGKEDGELTLHTGDEIIVTTIDNDSGWWIGYLKNDPDATQGLFPGSYVEIKEQQTQPTVDQEKTTKKPQKSTKNSKNVESANSAQDNSDDNIPKKFALSQSGHLWVDTSPELVIDVRVTGTVEKGRFKKHTYYKIEAVNLKYTVTRKWKDCLWLQNQFFKLFPPICIPTLLDLKVANRPNSETTEQTRLRALQTFFNRLAAHPVLAKVDFFLEFLQHNDEKKWERRKKVIEKKTQEFWRLVNHQYPEPDAKEDKSIESFRTHLSIHAAKIRNLTGQLSDLCSLKTDSISTTLTKFSNAWKDFGEQGFDWREEVPPNAKDASSKIESIIKSIAETWNTIGANYKEQSDFELGNSLRHFNEYSQIITNFQPALKTRDDARLNYHVTQNALIKAERNALQNEKEKLKIEQARKQTERAKEGADTTSIILLAESEHFRTSRLEDSKIMLAEYLDSQIDFYQKIVDMFKKIRPEIDNVSIQKGNNK
eukprot:Anaeramoba_ignava/a608781_126.p1 GENE.a608781_126~~a608781_126.p1  ORF type:complete len:492 (-),score=174.24 a608781_126:31-1506(-)